MLSLNPYIAGNPVGGTPNFVGRADVLREVLRVMRQPNQNIIVLYGQRRIGKTSVLLQLAARLPQEGTYYPVYFDLQDKASWALDRVLADLARAISFELARQGPPELRATGPLLSDRDTVRAFQEVWLPAVLNRLPKGHSIVLLFDEFDVLADPKGGQAGADLFPYLRGLMSTDPTRLQFAFVIGRKVEDLASIALSLFKGAPALRVSLLNKADTFELVRLSERNETLRWSEDALEKVWDLTHGHPFLTQQLCSRLWENLYDSDPTGKPTVVPEDVERAIPETLEASRNTLEWLWDGLPPAERVVISALAGAGNRAISQPQLEQLLRESGVRVVIRELQNAPQLLQDWDLIEPSDGGYRFRVELFREWILEHKPLSRVQEELDRIEPLAENLYQAAYGFFRNNQLEDAMPLLRQAIGLNPNHARSRQLLAEIFLLRGEVDQAVQILQLLYDTQPAIARPRLVQALLLKAEDEADDEKRLPIYQQILLIDPHHPITLQRVTDIQWAAYQREFTQRLTEIQKIEKDKRYREALDLARKLAEKYPDERNWQPDIDRLERKTKLAEDYQRAIGAWNSGDRETALRGLADVIVLEPDYEEATRYLHLVKTGHDPALMMNQLAGEQKAHNRAKTRLEEETLGRSEAEKQRDELQIRLESEQQHTASYRRMSWRMTYWAVASSVLALIFFVAWFVRGQALEKADLSYTQTAVAQAEINLTQAASITPDFSTDLPSDQTPKASTPTEVAPTPTDEPELTETAVMTDTETPVPLSNPFEGPVPKMAFARLGKGSLLSAALSPDGQWWAVGTTVGVYVYRADTFEEVWWVSVRDGGARLAFSADSTLLAYGSFKVEVLDAATGEFRFPLGTNFALTALVFSQTGNLLAVGDENGNVTLWDTGEQSIVASFESDGSAVTVLAFSPVQNLLVAGTEKGAIMSWDLDAENAFAEWGDHAGAVLSLAFSPDGTVLASGGDDARIQLWDVATQSEEIQSTEVEGGVFSLAYASSEDLLLSGLGTGEVVVWTLPSLQEEARYTPHAAPVTTLATRTSDIVLTASKDQTSARTHWNTAEEVQRLVGFAPEVLTSAYSTDGVLAVGYDTGEVFLWDAEAHEPLHTFLVNATPIKALAFSPVNPNLLAIGTGEHEVFLWNWETEETLPLEGHQGGITSLAFSPNGALLASGSQDKTVIVWSLDTNTSIFTSGSTHEEDVNSVAFSPDGNWLVSGDKQGRLFLWDLTAQEIPTSAKRLAEMQASIQSLAFSTDGKWLAVGVSDNTVRVLNMQANDFPQILNLEGHSSAVLSVAFSPVDATLLASGSLDSDVILWDVITGEPLHTFAGHSGPVNSLSFSPDGSVLASASSDGTVLLWDTNPEQLGTLPSENGLINQIAISPAGDLLASAAQDGTITLWDIQSRTVYHTFTGPESSAFSVAFSPAETHVLAAGFGNGEVYVWDLNNLEQPPNVLNQHTDVVYALAFSPDGGLLASGSGDANILLWNLTDPKSSPRQLEGHESAIYSLAFSPDGTYLASGSHGGNVLLWNVTISRYITTLNEGGHTADVFGLTFLDNTLMISGSDDKKLILWNVASGEKNEDFAEEPSGILTLQYNTTRNVLATGNRDGEIYLWPLATGSEPIILPGEAGEVYSLTFSPNGKILATAAEDGTIILWDLDNILP